MYKKLTSLAVALTATAGGGLAVAIPSASAQKPHAVYCEGSTNPYSQYTSCPPATTTTTSTTPTTTTTTTTATTSTTVTTPANADLSQLTQDQAYQYLASLPGITVSGGKVSVASVGASLPVGISLAPGVKVLANGNGFVTISDNGVTFSVPYGAQLTVSADGVANVTADGITQTFTAARLAHAAVKATKSVEQFVILPKGRTSDKFSYVLPKGVTFGKNTTWAKIASYFKVYSVTSAKSLGTSKKPIKATLVSLKSAANKGRTAFTLKLAKPSSAYAIVFNLKGLQTSKSVKSKTLETSFSTYSTAKKVTSKDTTSFTYVS